jgi:hypothetical protein
VERVCKRQFSLQWKTPPHRTSPYCVAPDITFLATNPITFLHRFNNIVVLSSKIHNRCPWTVNWL